MLPTPIKRALRRVLKLGPKLRQLDQLSHPPGHYYSPLPDFDALPAVDRRRTTLESVDVHALEQLTLLGRLAPFHEEQPFDRQPRPGRRYYFVNDYYETADGIAYYSVLRYLRPRQLIEVGSGFSSGLALDVNDLFFGGAMKSRFIDPNAGRLRSLLHQSDRNVQIVEQPVQSLSPDFASDLGKGDILFIDSSHVSKVGSDVNFLYFEVLPRLASGVWVHVHDIFWPFEYPDAYLARKWAWNEIYLLRALLCGSKDFRIVFFPSYLEANHETPLRKYLPLALTTCSGWPTIRGASIWIERI